MLLADLGVEVIKVEGLGAGEPEKEIFLQSAAAPQRRSRDYSSPNPRR
jgi:crotonobetainyl-CoA:carnitine CoA-transferase CaiB-like acyl-CoA transferase